MIKDRNIAEDAAIQPHKLLSAGVGEIFYVGTSGTAMYNVYRARVPSSRLFTSIAAALTRCVADRGDVIYVLPKHTESVAAAGGIAFNVAGVTVKGLGVGSLRPTITLATATAASVTVTAANVTIDGFIFIANLDNVATCFTISAAECTIQNCEFRDTSDALHFLSCILTHTVDAGCDGLRIINCKRNGLSAASTAFISILSNVDRLEIIGNHVIENAANTDVGHFLIMAAEVVTDAEIAYNKLTIFTAALAMNVGTFMTGSATTMTGTVHNNYCASTDTTANLFCTATMTFGMFENYTTGVLQTQGLLFPVADNPA